MKVALITDTHWGVRNDAPAFLDNAKKFLDNVFFPTIQKHEIKQVVHLGDLLDRRKYVAFTTSHRLWEDFMLKMFRSNVERFDLILGNHDVVHKNTNNPSGVIELYRGYQDDRFRIWPHPHEVALLDGTKVLYLPWINDENKEKTLELIKNTQAQICFGHLEIEGFQMYRGTVCEEGLNASLFNKFDVTCSGHFHHKSSKNGIHYLGSTGEFTWQDYNDERGFHIFDTKTRELEFIQNPYTMFEKIHYADEIINIVPDASEIEGKYVKVIVSTKSDPVKFEQFISGLEKCNPVDVQTVDDHLNAGVMVEAMDDVDDGEDTISIFRKATELYEGDRAALDSFINELYQEALAIE